MYNLLEECFDKVVHGESWFKILFYSAVASFVVSSVVVSSVVVSSSTGFLSSESDPSSEIPSLAHISASTYLRSRPYFNEEYCLSTSRTLSFL